MHKSTIIGGWLLAACLVIGLSTARAEESTKSASSELERFNDAVVEMGGKKPEGSLCKYTSECESRPGMRCARPRGAPLKVPTRCMLKG